MKFYCNVYHNKRNCTLNQTERSFYSTQHKKAIPEAAPFWNDYKAKETSRY